jgi:hypothetical protein
VQVQSAAKKESTGPKVLMLMMQAVASKRGADYSQFDLKPQIPGMKSRFA